jgi:hypothetical protein
MPTELEHYFNALHADSDTILLAESDALRRVGTRRNRTNRMAAGAAVGVVVVVGAVAAASAGGGPRVSDPGATASTAPTLPVPIVATPPATTPPGPTAGSSPSGSANGCTTADFGVASSYSDSGMGHINQVITFPVIAAHPCTLPPQPTVWLVDPRSGQSVRLANRNPFGAPHATKPITVHHGQIASITLNEEDATGSGQSGCGSVITYRTMKVQLADGVLTTSNLSLVMPCADPDAGDWSAS